ncbi:UL16-binding protein 1-like [Alexandromys fortis]|uniref:UL16-binding protein 1-like n=1 Tax=Alexandromys fortis TaxID=100897 RepID=UPI0021539483|nr:UL16-binding protein 1-like [Microtus fortis]
MGKGRRAPARLGTRAFAVASFPVQLRRGGPVRAGVWEGRVAAAGPGCCLVPARILGQKKKAGEEFCGPNPASTARLTKAKKVDALSGLLCAWSPRSRGVCLSMLPDSQGKRVSRTAWSRGSGLLPHPSTGDTKLQSHLSVSRSQEGTRAKPRNSLSNLFQMLRLLALLSCLGTKQLTDAASLCYTYTVNVSESGLSHKIQGQLDEKTFILCYHTYCRAIGGLGETLKAIQSWEKQVNTLKDGIDLVTGQALHMKHETDTVRVPFSLQVKKCCWHEANGNFNASCALYLNGQKVLDLHRSTGNWTEVDPGSMQIKEKLEKNKDLRDFLNKTSEGDCRDYLKKIIPKLDLEKKLEPTVLVKDTAGIFTSASPTIAPDVDQSSSMTMKPNAFALLFTLALLFLLNYLQ